MEPTTVLLHLPDCVHNPESDMSSTTPASSTCDGTTTIVSATCEVPATSAHKS